MSLGPSDNEPAHQSSSTDLTEILTGYVALVSREGLIEFAGQCEGGLTPERLVGHNIFDRVPSEARRILADKLGIVFETSVIEHIRLPAPAHCSNDGGIDIRLVPLVESGKPLQTVAVAFRRTLVKTQDGNRLADSDKPLSSVTLDELPCERSLMERQQMAMKLQQSEERFRQIAEASPQGTVIIQHDRVVYANPTASAMLDCAGEEIAGSLMASVTERFVDSDSSELERAKQEELRRGMVLRSSYEIKIRTALGRTRWIEIAAVPVIYEGDQAIQAALTDVTARKDAETALRDSEERYRTLVENAQNAIFTVERDGTLAFMNSVAARMLGGEANDFVGKNVNDLFPPDKAARHLTAVQRVIDSGRGETIENLTELQGQPRWHVTSINPLNRHDGRSRSAFIISTDVTETKRVSEHLKETESRFRNLIESIPAITYTAALDSASTTTYVSPQVESLLGIAPDDYIANPGIWEERLHPDDRDRVLAEVQRCHCTGEPFLSEYRMIHRNGSIVWFRDHAVILRDESGRPICLQGVQYDITESKAAEEKLRESDSRFKELTDLLPQTVFEFDADGKFTFVNRSGLELFGYTTGALEKGVSVLETLHPDDHERAWQNMISIGTGAKSKGNEYTAIHSDGTQFPVLVYTTRICRIGKVVGYRGILIDITERKRNEDAVRLSEVRFRALYKGSPLPTYTWQWNGVDFVLIDGNDAGSRITEGHFLNYLGHTANEIFEHQPDHIADIQLCYENRAIINREMKFVPPLSTGKALDLSVRCTYVPPDLVLVVTEDITQRKRDEEALKMSEERFRALYEGSPLPMVLFQWKNDDLELVSCNKAWNPSTMGTLPNLIGSPARTVLVGDPEFLESLYECFHKQTSTTLELCHRIWNTNRMMHLTVFAAYVPPDLLLIQAQDISERKAMEETLRSTNELLARERHALLDKNIALKEILGQSKDEANQVRLSMQSNIDKLILPILAKLREKSRESDRVNLDLLESQISDISSPFLRDIESRFVQLTPRETEICNMIKNGLQSKEIGPALGISVRTVEKFRQKIRDKLRVDGRNTNLTTFLRSIAQKR